MANYTRNKNLWRKVIGYGGQPKPIIETFVDPITELTYSLNLQETIRHRDMFLVKKGYISASFDSGGGGSGSLGEYEEALVAFTFSDSTVKTVNFASAFSGNPIIVLSVDQDNNTTNVNPYGISYTNSSLTFGVSAPFNGNVRYRAVYSPTYPVTVTTPYSGSIIISAKNLDLADVFVEGFSTTFDTLPSTPSEIRQTAWDASSLSSSNINIENISLTTNNNVSVFSAPYSKEIHFIVVD